MRATANGVGGISSSAGSIHSLAYAGVGLRRHQVGSLEPSGEEELHRLALLHHHLADSLQSLLPAPESSSGPNPATPSPSASFILFIPFLHKLLDTLLTCESDFKSILRSRNRSLASRPPLDRAVPDLLDRVIKTLDLFNAVSLSLHSLGHWSRHATIASSALHRPGPPPSPPQINRAARALTKLLLSAASGLGPSSSICRRCRICSTARHLHALASGLPAARGGESGGAAVLALAVYTISCLLHFTMWATVIAFSCSAGAVPPPPPLPSSVRQVPWAAAMSALQERIADELRRVKKEMGVAAAAGMLAETLAVEKSGREVMEMLRDGTKTEAAPEELGAASSKLEEGLGPLERKVREVFHRFVRCRAELLECLNEGTSSSSPTDAQ